MRRVVVTGMGMLTPLGCGVETTWSRLLKGASGAKQIDTFDVSDLSAKIACVIPRGDGTNGTFNPDQWMEPKEQRKVDNFIVFALCAARQALDHAGWRPTRYEEQISTGVMIGSGIGGVEGIGATSHHHLGIAKRDQPGSIADGVRAGRAGSDNCVIWTLQAELDRHKTGGEIDNPAGDEEW